MRKTLREPVEVEYEDGRLAIVWYYKVIETRNGKHKNYNITTNTKFTTITGIRQAVFVCKTDTPNLFNITTVEPPVGVEYILERPYKGKQHTKLILSKKIMNPKKGDKVKIKYYPRETDEYGSNGPHITMELYTPEPEPESKAEIIPRKNMAALLQWTKKGKHIPKDLKTLVTEKDLEKIKKTKDATITLDTSTNEISIEEK